MNDGQARLLLFRRQASDRPQGRKPRESLDISAYALKRLVNHSVGNDVTGGYVIMDVDRLREPMQRITDHIVGYGRGLDVDVAMPSV